MMMEADLRTLLVSDPALAALVPADNMRINLIAQGVDGVTVAIHRVSGVPGYTMQGVDGLIESRVQIDVWGADAFNAPGSGYGAAYPVAQRIKTLLSGRRGSVGTTQFQMIGLLSERQSSEDTDTKLYHRFSMDFEIWHRAS